MDILQKHIPKQHIGSKTGATARRELRSKDLAIKVFNRAKHRLADINNWYSISGNQGAEFQLTDSKGNEIKRSVPEIGNLIRIKLPAPPNTKGDGYDWVRIESFEIEKQPLSDEELYGFKVRPIKNPREHNNSSAHFYTDDATSSFLVYRKTNSVYALERGRNEIPNPSGSVLNKIRNTLVALSAMLGLSKPQWKILTEGILGNN